MALATAGLTEGPLTVAREEDFTGLGTVFLGFVALVDRTDVLDDRVAVGLRFAMEHLDEELIREATDNVD